MRRCISVLFVLALVCHVGGGFPHCPGGRVPALSAIRHNGFDHRFQGNGNKSHEKQEQEHDTKQEHTAKQEHPNNRNEEKEDVVQAFPRWWSKKQLLAYLQATGRLPEEDLAYFTKPSSCDTDW